MWLESRLSRSTLQYHQCSKPRHLVVDPALAQRVPGGGLVAGEHRSAEVAFDCADDFDDAGLGATEEINVRGVVAMYQENLRLEQENERLLQWQQAALKLAADNKQLKSLVKAVPEPAISYATARIIANSGGAYVRTIMIDAGSDDGLARGQAVISGEGLVGRLTEVGSRAARVLLITDLNSRVPVLVENSHEAAVLAGDNSDRPRLVYFGNGHEIKIGDRVVTSGEGGIFPPGLAVGVVSAVDGGIPRVEPYADLSQIGYVMAVDYGLSGGLPQPVPTVMPPAKRHKNPATDGAPR